MFIENDGDFVELRVCLTKPTIVNHSLSSNKIKGSPNIEHIKTLLPFTY
jgi:hypothetical protein